MAESQGLITRAITDSDLPDLEEFCSIAASAGLTNNASPAAMRYDWCQEQGGAWMGTWCRDTLISVSGCHPLPQVGPDVYRVLFRGCTLPAHTNDSNTVSKTHMNSIPFREHLPLQMSHAQSQGYATAVITTNFANPDRITSMDSSHRVLALLARQGLVREHRSRVRLYGTDQAVWAIVPDAYHATRVLFQQRHGL